MDTQPHLRARTFRNSHCYLDALKPSLPAEARRPFEIVTELLATLEAKAPDQSRKT